MHCKRNSCFSSLIIRTLPILAITTATSHAMSLSNATYLGGSGPDLAKAIAFDASNNIYVASTTGSGNFPGLAPGAFSDFLYKGTMHCVITKLDPTATRVLSSTVLPPPGITSSIYFDGVTKSDVAWNDRDCNPTAIRIDATGNIVVAGSTGLLHIEGDGNHASANLRGTMMGFVTKLDTSGKLVYSVVLGAYTKSATDGKNRYIGEKSKTFISSLALDASGAAYVGGWTDSWELPNVKGSLQETIYSNVVGGFVSTLDADGTVLGSTYLGGAPTRPGSTAATTHVNAITLDGAGNIVVVGSTDSRNMQISADAFGNLNEDSTSGFVGLLASDLKKLVYGSFIHPSQDTECMSGLADPFGRTYAAVTDTSAVSSDSAGNLYMVGTTTSPCLAVTDNAVQKTPRASSAGYLMRLNTKKVLDYVTYLDLGGDITSSLKVRAIGGLAAGSDASVYIINNAVGAQPALWPAYSAPTGQIRNLKTANIFLEHLTIAGDGSSSKIDSATGFGGTYSTVMLDSVITPDGKTVGVVGTTKSGDLLMSAGAISPTMNGGGDGLLALFKLP